MFITHGCESDGLWNKGPKKVHPCMEMEEKVSVISTFYYSFLNLKLGRRRVRIWGCSTANGVGAMKIIEGMMNAAEYTKIRLKHLLKSVSGLRLDTDFVSQQDNDNK